MAPLMIGKSHRLSAPFSRQQESIARCSDYPRPGANLPVAGCGSRLAEDIAMPQPGGARCPQRAGSDRWWAEARWGQRAPPKLGGRLSRMEARPLQRGLEFLNFRRDARKLSFGIWWAASRPGLRPKRFLGWFPAGGILRTRCA